MSNKFSCIKDPNMSFPPKIKTNKNKNHQDGMSQGNRYFKAEICNPKLQDIWVEPFISFLIRAFLFICTKTRGSRKAVYLLTDCDSPRKAFVAAFGQQADPIWLAMSLLCWKKPINRRKADSPCSFMWRGKNWTFLCSEIWYWVGVCAISLREHGKMRRKKMGFGRQRKREKEGDIGGKRWREMYFQIVRKTELKYVSMLKS